MGHAETAERRLVLLLAEAAKAQPFGAAPPLSNSLPPGERGPSATSPRPLGEGQGEGDSSSDNQGDVTPILTFPHPRGKEQDAAALRKEAMEHLDFAIAEFREMKMRPSLERALRHKELLKA